MTAAQPNYLQLAKQGNSNAIADVINLSLPEEVTAKVSLKDSCLRVMLDSATVPDQNTLVALVHKVLSGMNAESIRQVKVYGREIGEDFPHWQEEFELLQQTHSLNCVSDEAAESALVESSPDSSLEQNSQAPEKPSFLGAIWGAVAGATGAVGSGAAYVSETVTGTITGTVGTVSSAAVQTGGAIANTSTSLVGTVGNAALQAPATVGYVLDLISSSPQLQELTKALKVDWLLAIVDRVDIVQAETHVKKLQRKYPKDKPGGIAHRIITEKAVYAGGSGFVSSLLPGFATAMFAVDLAATMALQAEMIYQIAGAYGLNLHEPARKSEVLAVFGMVLGSNAAIKAGLGFARNVPVAGAVIGASSNAAMLYAIGSAACHFYEAKLTSASSATDLQASQLDSEEYLQSMLDQQIIMDQVLIHLVLAGNPKRNLKQLLPELQKLNLNPGSLDPIMTNPKALPPLEKLLNQLSQEFAVSLIAQCKKVAQADGVITPQEAKVLNAIKIKFGSNSVIG